MTLICILTSSCQHLLDVQHTHSMHETLTLSFEPRISKRQFELSAETRKVNYRNFVERGPIGSLVICISDLKGFPT
jgi:hypothetical protein